MLVLHPTSRCDVCLDDYTWVTPANSPHAISCGHIFCLTCLRALHPSSCPLCRKNFQPDRVKKLHVDKAPQEPDGTNVLLDLHSAVLLQRVAMVSGENTPDEDVMEVLNDVTEWLSTQSNDLSSNRPLQASVRALNRYRASQQALAKKREECVNLEKKFSDLEHSVEHELETAKAIEMGLLEKLEEVESRCNSKVETAEAQITSLQTQLMRYRHTNNPLPPPPQPLPLDRFPSLAQQFTPNSTTTNRHSQTFSYTTNGYRARDDYGQDSNTNGAPYTNTIPSADGLKNGKPHGVHANGYQTPSQNHLMVNGTVHARPMFVPDSTSGVEPSRSRKRSKGPVGRDGRSEGQVSTDRAGPSRNQSAPTPQHYAHTRDETEFKNTQTSQPYTQPQNKYPYIESDLFGIGRGVDQTNNNRARIIPGASPTQRVIPPREPPLPKFVRDRTHKFVVEQSPEKPRDRQSRRHRDYDRRRSFQGMDELASRISEHRGTASLSDGEDDIESRLVSASAFVSGYGSGYDEGYGYASTYHHGYMPSRPDGYAVPRSDSSDDDVGGLGLLDVPRNPVVAGALDRADGVDDMTTPRARHAEPHRRRANSTSEWRSIDLLTLPPSGRLREGSHRTLDEVLGIDGVHRETRPRVPSVGEAGQNVAGRNSMNSMNSSVSSWGTVHTSVRGSMSELGLIGLHRGGVTGQGSVAEGAHSTPVFPRDLEGEDSADTPRMSTFTRRVPLSLPVDTRAARLQVDNERSRHSRSLSHPEIPLPLAESNDRRDSHQTDQATRPPHSRQPSLTQSVSLDSGARSPSIYGSQPTGNALDLTFDAAVPLAVDTTGGTHAQIRAPAPRMGGPNVLDLWRSQL